jgi:hypothetical protein
LGREPQNIYSQNLVINVTVALCAAVCGTDLKNLQRNQDSSLEKKGYDSNLPDASGPLAHALSSLIVNKEVGRITSACFLKLYFLYSACEPQISNLLDP